MPCKERLLQEGLHSIPAVTEGSNDPSVVLSALKCAGLLQIPFIFEGELPEVEWDWDSEEDLDVGRLVALMGLAEAAPSLRSKAEELISSLALYAGLVPLPSGVREEALVMKAALVLPPEHLASRMLEELSFQGDFSLGFEKSFSRGVVRAETTLELK